MTSSSPSSSPPTSSSPGESSDAPEPSLDFPEGSTGPFTLNVCREVCPFTFVLAKIALEALPIGAVLRVIVDHEPATRNLPRSAAEWGQEVLGVTSLGGAAPAWAIDLRKRVR